MGREKKSGHGSKPGAHAKDRHRKQHLDWTTAPPPGLQARPDQPNVKSTHTSYLEFVENKDKKKKLEIQNTTDTEPPPGFKFVPLGKPELTKACREISREKGAMIFIVSSSNRKGILGSGVALSEHLHRIGHHIRATIVEEAREQIGYSEDSTDEHEHGVPEPIPESQEEINKQADAAIRDIFPRIPNTDRQIIIERSFNKARSPTPVRHRAQNTNSSKLKSAKQKKGPLVGLAPDIPLSRRVQLAVLAHIRHVHTRYDKLLNETSWENARKTVESLCLDTIVKWRADEETGRDQLDEILREVVVISDSESDDDEDDDSDIEFLGDASDMRPSVAPTPQLATAPGPNLRRPPKRGRNAPKDGEASALKAAQTAARKAQRGFKRYEAVTAKWEEARARVRRDAPMEHLEAADMNRTISHTSRTGYDHRSPSQHGYRPADGRPGVSRNGARLSLPPATMSGYVQLSRDMNGGAPYAAANPPDPYSRHEPIWAARSPHRRGVSDASTATRMNSPVYDSRGGRPLAGTKRPRPEELKDYLVPSIETPSPGAVVSSEPIFVRTIEPSQPRQPHEPGMPTSNAFPAPPVASAAFTVRPHEKSPVPGRVGGYPPHSASLQQPLSPLSRQHPRDGDIDMHQYRAVPSHDPRMEADGHVKVGTHTSREPQYLHDSQYGASREIDRREFDQHGQGLRMRRIVDERGRVIHEEFAPAREGNPYLVQPVDAPRYIDSEGRVILPPGHEVIGVHRSATAAPIHVPRERRVFVADNAHGQAEFEHERIGAVPVTGPRAGAQPAGARPQSSYIRIVRDEAGRMHEFVPVSQPSNHGEPRNVAPVRYVQVREAAPPPGATAKYGRVLSREPDSRMDWSRQEPVSRPPPFQAYNDPPPVHRAQPLYHIRR